MLIKKIKRFYLSKSRNFDLLNLDSNINLLLNTIIALLKKIMNIIQKIYLNECSYNKIKL